MKFRILTLPIVALLLVGCNSQNTVTPEPTEVQIKNPVKTIHLDEEMSFFTQVLPVDAPQEVIWTSSKTNIAIFENGILKPKALGKSRIVATSKVDQSISAYFNIEVLAPIVMPESLDITGAGAGGLVTAGRTIQLGATVLPVNAGLKEVNWLSSDESLATVSNTGLVSALEEGEVHIHAYINDHKGNTIVTDSVQLSITSAEWYVDTIAKVYNERTQINDYVDVIGKVVVSNGKGIIIHDETDGLFFFQPDIVGDVQVGDVVKGTGYLAIYANSAQISNGTITKITEDIPEVNVPTPKTDFDSDALETYFSDIVDEVSPIGLHAKPVYVRLANLLVEKDNSYTDIKISGSDIVLSLQGCMRQDEMTPDKNVAFDAVIVGGINAGVPRVMVYIDEATIVIS